MGSLPPTVTYTDPQPTLRLPRHKRLLRRLRIQHSLRLHTLLVEGAILVVAVTLILLGIALFVSRTEALSWLERQQQSALLAARTIDGFLHEVRLGMQMIGSLDPDALQANPSTLTGLMSDVPALSEVLLVDAQGEILLSATQTPHPVLRNRFTIPVSSWFLAARQGHSYTSDLQISAENQPYLLLALPTDSGGVIAGRLEMQMLWDVVSSLHTGRTGQVYILDRQGQLMAHPDSQLVVQRTRLSERPEVRTALARPLMVWSGQYRSFSGAEVIGSTQPINDGAWLVFAEITTEEAFVNTRRALRMLQSLSVLIGLSILIATYLMMNRLLIRPLKLLRNGAWRIGNGDLAFRIHLDMKNEIGQAAEAFDQMAADLQLRETALAQARDQAMAASQFKSRLLANVSHDLRTPLNGITGFADMLREEVYGPLGDKQRAAVERILANTNRLLTLVNSLLDQSQIEAGQLQIQNCVFAPAGLLQEMEGAMGVLAQQKGIRLETRLGPDLPRLLVGDPVRLQQVLTNLVDNAVKFTDHGTVQAHLYRDGERWIIRVRDTGRGIPTEALQRIFQPFQLVDSSTTRDRRGVGLGLSIVYQLAALMGGSIEVASQIGAGSTFTVRLPLTLPEENPHA